jgi:aryl-alcohol dehydrogenase-like predicted oxidoreductase
VKYPQGFALPSDREVRELLALAFDLGINLLDTAPAYGLSEERIGKLLPTSRHEWVIETKVGERFVDGVSSFDFSAAGTRQSVENSLRLLKTDYLDMVLIHSDGDDVRILREEAVLDTLLQMQQDGWVRAVGISSKTVEGALLAYQLGSKNPVEQALSFILEQAGATSVVLGTINPKHLRENVAVALEVLGG